MPDPTDAEIAAGALAIARSWRVLSHSSRRHLAKLVLTDVLPDHDAAVRADERAKVDHLLSVIDRALWKARLEFIRVAERHGIDPGPERRCWAEFEALANAARTLRQHAERPITDWHGAAPTAHDGSKWGTDCPACPDRREETP